MIREGETQKRKVGTFPDDSGSVSKSVLRIKNDPEQQALIAARKARYEPMRPYYSSQEDIA